MVQKNPSKPCRGHRFLLIIPLLFLACQPAQFQNSQEKVFHYFLVTQLKGFDPIYAEDAYTNVVISSIQDTVLQYAYLKRPLTLEPCLAEKMPRVSSDHLIYTLELKKNVYFTPDPAFGTTSKKGRELVAQDLIYSLKRLADAKLNATGWWLLKDRIQGLDAFYQASQSAQPTDYNRDVAGLVALDRYRLQIRLKQPYPQLLYVLAMPYTAVVAREVVEHYGPDFLNHPVGTGPFMLDSVQHNLKITLKRNPNYRLETFPDEGEAGDAERGLLRASGKRLPMLDKVVFSIFLESNPRWLNFLKGHLDVSDIPKDNYNDVVDANGELTDKLMKRGIQLTKDAQLDLTYIAFNMDHPILGKNLKLRQALSLALDPKRRIELMFNGRALPAQGPIPPGLAGYDADLINPNRRFDPSRARKLLAEAGYPNGKGLEKITLQGVADNTQRQGDELLLSEWRAVGVNFGYNNNTWPELLAKIHKRQADIFGISWGADYPDAENFLALFYSGNASPGNNQSNYHNPEYDRLYEQARNMSDSAERTRLYAKMARLVIEDVPLVFGEHRVRYTLFHDWFLNYKPHPIRYGTIKYYDIDTAKRNQLQPML